MRAAVGVLIRSSVVTVQVEGAVVLVLVVVTAAVENNAGSVVVRVVAQNGTPSSWCGNPDCLQLREGHMWEGDWRPPCSHTLQPPSAARLR